MPDDILCPGLLHLHDGEPAFAEIFEAGADVIDIIVEQQKTVVTAGEHMHGNGGILTVVPPDVKLELGAGLPGIDFSGYTFAPLVKQGQHTLVDVVVNEDNPLAGTLHQTADELIGVINLSVEENALDRRQGRADKEVYLLFRTTHPLLQFFKPLIEGIALEQILFQHAVGPLAKHRGIDAVHPVANGQYGIEVVKLCLV